MMALKEWCYMSHTIVVFSVPPHWRQRYVCMYVFMYGVFEVGVNKTKRGSNIRRPSRLVAPESDLSGSTTIRL